MPISRSIRATALTTCLLCSPALLASTLVITDVDHPVTAPPNTQVILLDQPATLEAALSTDLPPNPAQAEALIQKRMTPELSAQISQAHQNVANAWSLGVTKIPAVVVDQQYVVYGEPDVHKALQAIARHRESQP